MDATEKPSTVPPDEADALPVGSMLLRGSYRVSRFIASGGFGKTYLAVDNLDRTVVIKECFPISICRREGATVIPATRASENDFSTLLDLFKSEARNLSVLSHPNIVSVHQVFDDNGTAYMVLDYIEGRDLAAAIADPARPLKPDTISDIAKKLIDAVATIHEAGVLHRDLSPDNILLTKANEPVLIDFGAARQIAGESHRRFSALRTVKDGYSPQEFYSGTESVSFSSDLYALAASLHHAIVGYPPPTAQERVAAVAVGETDPYTPISGRAREYDRGLLMAIDRALGLFPIERPQSAKEWKQLTQGFRIPNRASQRQSADRSANASHRTGTARETGAAAPPTAADDPLKTFRGTEIARASAGEAVKPALAAGAALLLLGVGGGVWLVAGGTETATTSISDSIQTKAPINADLVLKDGTAFEQIRQADIAYLRVKTSGGVAPFEDGDILVALMPLGQSIGTAETFASEIKRARAQGLTSVEVAVRRGHRVIMVPLDLSQEIIS